MPCAEAHKIKSLMTVASGHVLLTPFIPVDSARVLFSVPHSGCSKEKIQHAESPGVWEMVMAMAGSEILASMQQSFEAGEFGSNFKCSRRR